MGILKPWNKQKDNVDTGDDINRYIDEDNDDINSYDEEDNNNGTVDDNVSNWMMIIIMMINGKVFDVVDDDSDGVNGDADDNVDGKFRLDLRYSSVTTITITVLVLVPWIDCLSLRRLRKLCTLLSWGTGDERWLRYDTGRRQCVYMNC